MWRVNETFFNLRVSNKQFVGLEDEGGKNKLVAGLDSPGKKETFEIVRNNDDRNRVRIRAANGLFLQVVEYFWLMLLIRIRTVKDCVGDLFVYIRQYQRV